jgi:hypothetical protein
MIGKAVQAYHEGAAPSFEDREIEPVGTDRSFADMATGWTVSRLKHARRSLADVVQGRGRGAVRHGYAILVIITWMMIIIQHTGLKDGDAGFANSTLNKCGTELAIAVCAVFLYAPDEAPSLSRRSCEQPSSDGTRY